MRSSKVYEKDLVRCANVLLDGGMSVEEIVMLIPGGVARRDDGRMTELLEMETRKREAEARRADQAEAKLKEVTADYDELLSKHEQYVNEMRNELNKLDMNPFVKVLYSSGHLDKKVGGRNRLYEWLRDVGVFMKSKTAWNEPYQTYFDRGWFKYQEKDLPFGESVNVPIITKKGCSGIVEMLRKDGLWHSDLTYEEVKKEMEASPDDG